MSNEPSALMQAMQAEAGTMLGVDLDTEQLDLLADKETGRLPSTVFRDARALAARQQGRPKGAKNRKTQQLAKLIVQKHGDPVLSMAEIYSMSLDRLVELLLIADGSQDRQERLMVLVERSEELMRTLMSRVGAGNIVTEKEFDAATALVDRVSDLARSLKAKPGELALKALIAQRDAAKEVAQYVHGKMPVQVDVNTKADVILNIPGLTDMQHLAEIVGEAGLSDQDLNRLEHATFREVTGDGDIEDAEIDEIEDGDED